MYPVGLHIYKHLVFVGLSQYDYYRGCCSGEKWAVQGSPNDVMVCRRFRGKEIVLLRGDVIE